MPKLPHFSSIKDPVRITGFSTRIRNLASDTDIRTVVSALTLGHLDPGGREITDIGNFQRKMPSISVRLDRQANTSDGAANLQIQVNDSALAGTRLTMAEGTTISQVLVPADVYRSAFSCQVNVRNHLENVVRSALLESSNSHGIAYRIVAS